MNTAIIGALVEHPSVFVLKFLAEPLAGAALAYGLVWLAMRPKGGRKIDRPFFWHSCGLVATVMGAATIRIMAIVTFAGLSAYELANEGGVAGFYMLVVPAMVAVGYIRWLRTKAVPASSPEKTALDLVSPMRAKNPSSDTPEDLYWAQALAERLHGAEDVPTPLHVPDADSLAPSEACGTAALAEFESAGRRPGLWAKVFSEADGNEAIAKAGYLRSRAVELERQEQSRIAALRQEEESRNAALRHQAAEAEARKRDAERVEAERAYAALAKGVCPNHRCGAIIPLNSQACPKCGAIFEAGAAWKVLP